MYTLVATANNAAIFGPISQFLGFIMNAIYDFFEKVIGIQNVNIGLVIIIFTIIIYSALFPLTYKQQKFSFMMRKMSPEIQAIQKKYKNRKSQDDLLAAQEEQRAIYDKYGVSPSGSCIQLVIQLPILWALYSVFRGIPAYIKSIYNIFENIVPAVQNFPDYQMRMQYLVQTNPVNGLSIDFLKEGLTNEQLGNYIIDVAYKLNESGWSAFANLFHEIKYTILSTKDSLDAVNYIGLLNMSDSPLNIITTSFSAGAIGVGFAAILIPVLSFLSQVVNIRTMNMANNTGSDMGANQMKAMNRIMPFISVFFVFSVPIGLGIYWIAGAFYRCLLQLLCNRHFEKIDMDAVIEQNKEKAKQKAAKRRAKAAKYADIRAGANTNTKRTATDIARMDTSKSNNGNNDKSSNRQFREGSMASKANMVSDFNKKNSRK